MFHPKSLRLSLVFALLATTLAIVTIQTATAPKAEADLATGGLGRFKSIEWFSWGADGAGIPDSGMTRTQTYSVAGQTLAVTCSLSNIAGAGTAPNKLVSYRPGNWKGDSFDDLYNIGGTGTNNQLVVGLTNGVYNGSVTFNFSCGASLAGNPIPLSGLVMADAEATGGDEFVSATIPAAATWRLIDRYRGPGCTTDAFATRTTTATTQTLRLTGATPNCENTFPPAAGSVAFMEGATSATNVTIKGTGRSAIALGVAIDFDFGDAPASYGVAGTGLQYSFTGGEIPATGAPQGIYNNLSLANATQPPNTLGRVVDPEVSGTPGPGADTDDTTGSATFGGPDDEEAVTLPAQVVVTPGQPYTLPGVTCRGTYPIAGWIDFNLNGTFDANERSNVVNCNGSAVALTWTVPVGAVPGAGLRQSYLRLRMVPPGVDPQPTGLLPDGEVEDHRIGVLTLPPQITLTKNVAGRVAPADQFTVTTSGGGLPAAGVSATTSGTGTTATTGPQLVQTGTTYTLRDAMATGSANPLSDYVATIQCVDAAAGNAAVATTGTAGNWSVSNLALGQDVRCTITNTPRQPAIDVVKTAGTTTGPDANGNYSVTYQVQVTNTGAVTGTYGALSDTPGFAPNIGVDSATWTTTGAGAPAGGSQTGAGPFQLAPANTAIARDTTHTYNVTMRYHYTNRTTATACAGPGTGLYNSVALPAGQETGPTTNNAACVAPAAAPAPSMTLSKQASPVRDLDGNGPDAGDRIDYTFTVTNTGNVTITNVGINDPKVPGTTCAATSLAPGASTTCTGSYTLTLADANAGNVTNVASASGSDPQGAAVTSPNATTTTTFQAESRLLLDKIAGTPVDANASGRIDAGDRISYQFQVTNTGSVTLSNLTISDNLLTGITCSATSLAPGASTSCTASPRTITQADVDAGAVNNTATASATRAGGTVVTSNPDSTSTALNSQTTLSFDKQAAAPVDVNSSGLTDAGDTIRYTFLITNTGTTTVSNVAINDPKLTAAGITSTCAPRTLVPGATATCTTSAAYVVTEADESAGVVANTANPTATGPGGTLITTPADSTSTVITTPRPALLIDKRASAPTDVNGSGLTDAGDTIGYSFTVTNTGNVPLRQVAVNDAKLTAAGLTITCPTGPLAVGASATCTVSGPYRVTSADVTAGAVNNSATATAIDPDGGNVASPADTTSTPTTAPAASLVLDKVAAAPTDTNRSGITDRGDTIAYTFRVTNPGNVPIRNVTISDSKLTGAGLTITCPGGPLAPGASITCAASGPYSVTDADVTAGRVANSATAGGIDPDGVRVTSPPDTTSTSTTAPVPALNIDKRAAAPVDVNSSGITDAGDTISYSFTVTNTGNVPISGITVSDPKLTNAGLTILCAAGTVAPGASIACTVSRPYTVTEADEAAGTVANSATASGRDPDGGAVLSPADSTSTSVTTPKPALTLDKEAGNIVDTDNNGNDVGDQVSFTFVVTNSGNVPMTNISITDQMLTNAGLTITCPTGVLAPGATRTCTASGPYTLTAGDLNRGSLSNSATARGVDPDSTPLVSAPDTTFTQLNQNPGLILRKRAAAPADVNGSGITDAGDEIGYSFTVENPGNVTISNIAVSDPKLTQSGVTITCPATSLAAGSNMTCVAEPAYRVTAADVAAGSVDNTASASGRSPTGAVVNAIPSSTSTPTTQPTPALALDKTAGVPVDVNSSGLVDVGDTISYTFTITNTGNVPIVGVSISDPKLAGADVAVSCPTRPLAVGASMTCTSARAYSITAADVASGSVANTATASGVNPDGGPVTSPPDSTSTPTTRPQPGLSLDKQAGTPTDVNGSGITDAGDTIAYTFKVTNTGNVPARILEIADRKLTDSGLTVTCPPSPLAPGAEVTCTASRAYVVTGADVANGSVDNTATASALDPDGLRFSSNSDETSTRTTRPAPRMSLDKTAQAPVDTNDSGITDAGDEITYSFAVTNSGNVPINAVTISDPMLAEAGVSVVCPPVWVAPGAVLNCITSRPYIVTAADVAAGAVANTAAAAGTDPDGGPVASAPDSASTPTTTPDPKLTLLKTAGTPTDVNNSGLTDAGDTIAYSFVVTNSGNVPIDQLRVRDEKLANAGLTISCPAGPLPVGASRACSVSGPYVITAGDVQSGSVVNQAVATGVDPDAGVVTSPIDDSNTPTTQPQPSLSVDKRAAAPVDVNGSGITDAGDTIGYSFTVTNTGNVPVGGVSVSDAKLTGAGLRVVCPAGVLARGASVECVVSGPYVVSAGDVAAGAVANTATASGVDPDGGGVVSAPDSTSTPTTVPAPRLVLDKQAGVPVDVNGSGITDAGDTVEYSFLVVNDGNVPLTAVSVSDAKLAGAGLTIECPAGPVAPGASVVCTVSGPYVVTAADVAAGGVVNTASASATDPDGGTLRSVDSTTTPTVRPGPALTVDKRAGVPVDVNGSGITDAGDEITYAFTVTNNGNVPIRDVSVVDAKLIDAGLTVSCAVSRLAPAESTQCVVSGPYRVTAADVAAGLVSNTATADGVDPDGGAVSSPPDSTGTPTTVPAPRLTVDKRAGAPVDVNGSGITDAGDTITYAFTVTNTGNVPVRNVDVVDAKLTGAGLTISCPVGPLAPGGVVECTASGPYVVSAGDVADGSVANAATAVGVDPDGARVSSPADSTSTPTTRPAPRLGIDKRAGAPVDVNGSGITDAGDTVLYEFTVTNTGNVPVRQVGVVDEKLTDGGLTISCPTGPLAPGGVVECTASGPYVITAADVTAGQVRNVASGTGVDPDGGAVTSSPDQTVTRTVAPAPALVFDKQAAAPVDVNGSGLVDAGDTIEYSFVVSNTGNVPLRQVAVTDAKLAGAGLSITCPGGPLAPGASVTCTVSGVYVVTRADVGAGQVANTADVGAVDPDGVRLAGTDSTVTPTVQPRPALSVDKVASAPTDVNGSGITDAGDTIVYSFAVTNNGNVPVDSVGVRDAKLAAAGITVTCPEGRLAVGATVQCSVSGPYVVSAGDVAAGGVVNTATVAGVDPDGDLVASPPDETTTQTTRPAPGLSVDKRAGTPVDVNNSGITDAGDTIAYEFTVTNTGNVPVAGVVVSDAKLADAGLTISCPEGPVAPGASTVCAVSGPYVVTAEDVTASVVVNTATASGSDPDGNRVVSGEDSTSTSTTTPEPGLSVDKRAAAPVDVNNSGITDAGDTIAYEFTVTNTGNVPVGGVSVTDVKLADAGLTITCPQGRVLPGASVECVVSGPYVVSAGDVAAGAVANTATASGVDPDGGGVVSAPDSTSTPTTVPAPRLVLDKQAGVPVDVNGSGITDAGDTVEYSFLVVNDGNVPLTAVSVSDAKLAGAGLTVECPAGPVAPGASVVCTVSGPYVVTAADVAAGGVVNTASASAIDPDGGTLRSVDSTTTPTVRPGPALTVDKRAGVPVDVNGSGITDAGDEITYAFTVTNNGNVPVRQVSVVDPRLAEVGITITCQAARLAPAESTQCVVSGPYRVTAADVAAGLVSNTATADGVDPDGGAVSSPPDSTGTPTTVPAPRLGIDKRAGAPVDVNGSGITDAGDTITYEFTVTNTGNVPIRQVSVADPKLTDAGLTITCPTGPLAPSGVVECTASGPYVITAADVTNRAVDNTATATGINPDAGPVQSLPASTSTPTTRPVPRLGIDKRAGAPVDVNGSGITDAGDTVLYEFTVTNTGNVPVRQVGVVDEKLTGGGLTISCPTGPLAPGGVVECTASGPYVITAADVAAGSVANTATGSGVDPDGGAVTSSPDRTVTRTVAPAPALVFDKQAAAPVDVNGSGLVDAGDTIEYSFVVSNTGNVPLRQVAVTDAKLAGAGLSITCPGGPLAPGASVTCTVSGVYVVTRADVGAGQVANTADVGAVDPDGVRLAGTDSTVTPTVQPRPALSVDKVASAPTDVNGSGITDAGDTIVYSFAVTNNGNVPVDSVGVRDEKLAAAGITVTCPEGRLAVGASVQCSVSGPYVVSAGDVAAGGVVNTATVAGVDPDGDLVASPPDETTTQTTRPAPGLSVDKRAGTPVDVNNSGITDAGDTIAYEFTVTNTGNVPVAGVVVNDAKLADAGLTISCPEGPVAPGASVVCAVSGPYVVTAEDVTATGVVNTATASGSDPDGNRVVSGEDSTSTSTTTPQPGLSVDKRAGAPVDVNNSGITDAGDTIAYEFTVTNTGNVPVGGVSVTDAKLTDAGLTITCPQGRVLPGASVECVVSGPYVVSAGDVAAGAVANTATASGTNPDGGTVQSPPDATSTSATQPVTRLILDKQAGAPVDVNNSGLVDAGDTIDYTFTVINASNVPIAGVAITDPVLTAAGIGVICPSDRLLPGATVTCSATGPYPITAADVDAGQSTNTATVTGTDPDGTVVTSAEDSTSTPTVQPRAALTIDKRAGAPVDVNSSGITDAGDEITYAFTVTNNGNVPVRQVEVNDPKLTEAGLTMTCPAGPLAPGASAECTVSGPYVVTAPDAAAGALVNTATAAGIDPDDVAVASPQDSTTTPTRQPVATLTLDKRAGDPVDVNNSGITDAGDTITYEFTVTNTGNVPIRQVSVTDPKLTDAGLTITCPTGPLAPSGVVECTASGPYVITAADVTNRAVDNTATATGINPDAGPVQSPPASTSTPTTRPAPRLGIDKRAGAPVDVNGSGITDAGDTVLYEFTVTNTGNVPVRQVGVVDEKLTGGGLTISCPTGPLAPGGVVECTASGPYVITAADVTAGQVRNVASGTGVDPDGGAVTSSPDQTVTRTVAPAPALVFDKQAAAPVDVNGSGLVDAGDTIEYSFVVSNTGNVPLRQVAVTDAKLAGAGLTITCPGGPLAPGTSVTCTVSGVYVVTRADVGAGQVANTADVGAVDPDGVRLASTDSTVTPTVQPRPALSVDKVASAPTDVNGSGITDAGDTIAYSFTVTNNGNVPVRSIGVRDAKLAAAGITIVCPPDLLAPAASVQCSASGSYSVTSADVAAGVVENTATAAGVDPDNAEVTSPVDSTQTATTRPNPGLSVDKRAGTPVDVNNSGITDAGDTIAYEFTVTNTGNVPVAGVVVSDPKLADAGLTISCPEGPVAPGASTVCAVSGPYVVTAEDVTASVVVNTATASGSDPDGNRVVSGEDSTSTSTTTPEPGLSVDKRAGAPVDVNNSGITDAGDTIAYEFTVTNTGNVPVGGVSVTDVKLADAGLTITCPEGRVLPGASVECVVSGPYVVSAGDVAAGAVANTATASGVDPDGGGVVSAPDSTSTPTTVPAPRLLLDKKAGAPVDVNSSGLVDAGDTIDFTFTVSNDGNVPMTGVAITDPVLTTAGIGVSCPSEPLAPGASVTCTATAPYPITAGDVAAGGITNTATASGTDPDSRVVTSPEDSTTTTTVQPRGALTVDKRAAAPVDVNASGITDAGDTIRYAFTVTNNGNVPIRQVEVNDPKLTEAGLTMTCPAGPLAPGASTECTVSGPYVVTGADVAAGAVVNTATAAGVDPDGGAVTSPEDATTTQTRRPVAALALDKRAGVPVDVNGSGITDAGDTITYEFTVTNTGNVPVRQVAVSDSKLTETGLTIECPPGPLAPGASTTCTSSGPYVISAADVAGGRVENSATVAGVDPDGVRVTSPGDSTSTSTTRPAPRLGIDKRAGAPVDVNGSGITDAGDEITYEFTVTNTGNVPVRQLGVVDAKLTDTGLTIDCPTGPLAPGASRTCAASGPYVITAADVAAGSVANTATGAGVDPDGGAVTSSPDRTVTRTVAPAPALVFDKQAAAPVDVNGSGLTDAGDTIAYTFVVSNPGNVPLRNIAITDAKLTDAGLTIICPSGPLAPGTSATCTVSAAYVVTRADVATGQVANSASATAADPDGGRLTGTDATISPTTQPGPALSVDKVASAPTDVNGSGITDAGDSIAYSFTVTNNGNVPIRSIVVRDEKLAAAGITIVCPPDLLAPAASVQCSVSGPYVVSAGDVAAGGVVNTATVAGVDPDGDLVASPPDETTTQTTRPAPGLSIDKRAGTPVDVNNSGITDAGDTIAYEFTVTNTGNVPVAGVVVNDAKLADAGLTISCPEGPVAPGASTVCAVSGPYVVTAEDVTASVVVNTATASGSDPDGNRVVSGEDSTSTSTTTPQPGLSVDKRAAAPVDVNNSGITDAGDTIAYEFTVTNTGNVPVGGVSVTDAKLTDAGLTITCPQGRVLPGASVECVVSGPYVVSAGDVAAGAVANTATASGTNPDGGTVQSPPDATSTSATQPVTRLILDKQAGAPVDVNNSGLVDAGDTIDYTFTVINASNVPIAGVAITDPVLTAAGIGVICPSDRLLPGATVTCSATGPYPITAAEVDAGQSTNTATVTGTDPDGTVVTSAEDSTSTPTVQPRAALTIDKRAGAPVDVNGSGITDAGDEITYAFTVTNNGNVPVRQVEVNDPKLTEAGLTMTCPAGPLAPGASAECTVSGPYVVTGADVAAGAVVNTATAAGVDPDGGAVTSPEDATTTQTRRPVATLTLDKRAGDPVDVNNSGITDAGDTITYEFTVTNTGNVPIRQVSVADPKLTDAGLTITCPTGPLAPSGVVECTASGPYVITAADVTNRAVDNTATATGINPDAGPVQSPPASTTTQTTAPAPSLSLDKQAQTPVDVNGSGLTDAGDQINYTFTIRNTGNVPIRQLEISDPNLTDTGLTIACPDGPLAPGTSTTCTASGPYRITAADVAAGSVENTATGTGIDPDGDQIGSGSDSTSTATTRPAPSLILDKAAGTPVDVNGSGLTDAGDEITYTFGVINNGNVPLSAITINDRVLSDAGLTTTCPPARLAPGASLTCTVSAPYVVTAADVTAGQVANTATATGTDPDGGSQVSATDSTVTPTVQPGPALALDKRAGVPQDVNNSGLTDAGDTIAYTFTVANNGNVPIRDVTVSDPMLAADGVQIACPEGPLAPGATVQCLANGPHVVTEDDLLAGVVTNIARVSGTEPDGVRIESPADSTTTPTQTPAASLQLDKRAATPIDVNESGLIDAGDQIVYTFLVTNTGNVPLTELTVTDEKLAEVGIQIACPEGAEFAINETVLCTTDRPYVITEQDVAFDSVDNVASASAIDPDGNVVPSPEASVSVATTKPAGKLVIDKIASAPVDTNESGLVDAGDLITYVFTVTNAGNVPIENVVVNDERLTAAGIAVSCPSQPLALGESVYCEAGAAYAITADDVAAGEVFNEATAAGLNPDGATVTSEADFTYQQTAFSDPKLIVDKQAATPVDANNSGLVDAGDTIQYSFVVNNSGNVTIRDLTVTDEKLAAAGITIACPETSLTAGSSMICTTSGRYVITAEEETAGVVSNSATASGIDPVGGTVSAPPDTTNTATAQNRPALTLDKRAGQPDDVNESGNTDRGDTVPYFFTVTNNGNVPISNLAIRDRTAEDVGSEITCPPAPLAPGASVECTASHPVPISREDVSRGALINTATAVGTDPDGVEVVSPEDSTITPTFRKNPSLQIEKQAGAPVDANGSGITDAGDTVEYAFVVTNIGNVPIREIGVVDPRLANAGITISCPRDVLAVGAVARCTADTAYTLTVADASAGAAVNTATATGLDTEDVPIESTPNSTTTPVLEQLISLLLDKQAADPVDVNDNGEIDAGDTVTYTFVVTNAGNVTMREIGVFDPMLRRVDCPTTPLAAGDSMTCTAPPYVLTQEDIDAGHVSNTATATGLSPSDQDADSPPDSIDTSVATDVQLDFTKEAELLDGDGDGLADVGERIRYVFTVANIGNVRVTQVDVNDQMLADRGVVISCAATVLAPLQRTTCEAELEVTADDVLGDSIDNTAFATARGPNGVPVPSNEHQASVPVRAPSPGEPSTTVTPSGPGGNTPSGPSTTVTPSGPGGNTDGPSDPGTGNATGGSSPGGNTGNGPGSGGDAGNNAGNIPSQPVPPVGPGTGLPNTGGPSMWWLILGLLLCGCGVAIVWFTRRRKAG